MAKSKITVIGSINMDLVTSTSRIPKVGETLLGDSFHTIPGGKGANQAVAAARLGAEVTMIGAVGDDSFGETVVNNLTSHGINTEDIIRIKDCSTGIASITVSDRDNSIIVVPGANDHITLDIIEQNEDKIKNSDILLLQLEIPLESVIRAVQLAKKHNTLTILNPAPIRKLPMELLEMVDYLTPNEHEQTLLFGSTGGTEKEVEMLKEKCIVTKGSKGVMLYHNGDCLEIPSIQVEAVDTTGAGDSFNGALAFSLCAGTKIEDGCRFANVVGAISVTKLGAQTGMPSIKEVDEFLQANKLN
ncbi:ribokinase [Sporosarcina thermotolerans]|uniref:Ribokinase n=1 Tax=Sporosarcina thermotolerans TaxID=633404 RepID=A0AAW9A9D6_9BACL|nr:ribokinase [Sporosarcina thermotolerans]MDW0116515.1 ribokinase [Sporosarcina thermotolerans]